MGARRVVSSWPMESQLLARPSLWRWVLPWPRWQTLLPCKRADSPAGGVQLLNVLCLQGTKADPGVLPQALELLFQV